MSFPPPSTEPPARIGDYELLLPVGTGGTGTVYLARREVVEGVHRSFAVKVLHPHLAATEGIAESLVREARLAARVHHHHVVQVLEARNDTAGVFLAMDYVEGDTLSALIRAAIKANEPIPLPVVARIVLDALAGLHAAHEVRDDEGRPLELVHRDFSPQNLLVGVDGLTRLTDFGIAKAVGQVGATATGIVKGKVTYMAPEQALGRALDRRCDIWAAGVVLWEALASRRLYETSNDAETLLRLVDPKPQPRVSTKRREVSQAVDEVLADALCHDVKRRIGDAAELARRIEAAFDEHGVASHLEVARHVERTVHSKLAERRKQLIEVTRLRDELGRVSREATRGALDSSVDIDAALAPSSSVRIPGLQPLSAQLEPVTGARALSRDVAIPSRSRPWRWGAMALVAAGVALLLWQWSRDRAQVASAQWTKAIHVVQIAETPTVGHAREGEGEAAPLPSSGVSRTLHVEANAPIAQLNLDKRSIVLPDAATSIEIPLDVEQSAPLEVVAIAKDGRRAVVHWDGGEARVVIAFGAPSAPVRKGTRRKPKAKTADDDGLADSPYGGRRR